MRLFFCRTEGLSAQNTGLKALFGANLLETRISSPVLAVTSLTEAFTAELRV